jgi:KDEL-tailed cysteine endopeptidase
MIIKLITVLMFAYALTIDPVEQEFNNFVTKHGKKYKDATEKAKRLTIFKNNYSIVQTMSLRKIKHQVGVTKYFDLTQDEFAAQLLGFKDESITTQSSTNVSTGTSTISTATAKKSLLQMALKKQTILPANFDWRDKGKLTPIKDQQTCGGCWSFSTAANIESQILIKYGVTLDIAEQNMLNCDTLNYGCNGGSMVNAFKTIIAQGGAVNEVAAPYQNTTGTCTTSSLTTRIGQIGSYAKLTSTDEDVIAKTLYQYGPLSIALNSNLLQFYVGGIFNDPTCSTTMNHAVNIVGYGVDSSGTKYWVVRNSWGISWGENGYFRIARGVGMCGLNKYVATSFAA